MELSSYWERFTIAPTGDVEQEARRIVAGQSAEQVVAAIEALRDDRAEIARATAKAKLAEEALTAVALDLLGEGEAVTTPSGRVVYRGEVSDGSRSVNRAAVDDLEGSLPEDLRPRPGPMKYPTIGEIEKAVRERRLERSVADVLIRAAGTRPGLRWRTIDDVGGAS